MMNVVLGCAAGGLHSFTGVPKVPTSSPIGAAQQQSVTTRIVAQAAAVPQGQAWCNVCTVHALCNKYPEKGGPFNKYPEKGGPFNKYPEKGGPFLWYISFIFA